MVSRSRGMCPRASRQEPSREFVPQLLARVALPNKRVVYDLLFQAAAATLQVAANPNRLGAAIGGLMVLPPGGNACSIAGISGCDGPGRRRTRAADRRRHIVMERT